MLRAPAARTLEGTASPLVWAAVMRGADGHAAGGALDVEVFQLDDAGAPGAGRRILTEV